MNLEAKSPAPKLSGFLDSATQVFSGDCCMAAVTSDYFHHFLRILGNSFHTISTPANSTKFWSEWYPCFKLLKFCLSKKPVVEYLTSNRQLIKDLLNSFRDLHINRDSFNYKKDKNGNLDQLETKIVNSINLQKSISELILSMCNNINAFDSKARKIALLNLIIGVKDVILALRIKDDLDSLSGIGVGSGAKILKEESQVHFT